MLSTTPNRERILVSAQQLILAKGFPATTIDEVCASAKVTKGGFYYHFKSKDELASAVVDHYFVRVSKALSEGDYTRIDDPVERVLAFVDHAVDVAQGPVLKDGCILGVLTLDLAETHPEIRREIARKFVAIGAGFESDLAAALARDGADPRITASGLARQFLAVLEGSIVLAKANDDPRVMAEALTVFRIGLEAMLARTSP